MPVLHRQMVLCFNPKTRNLPIATLKTLQQWIDYTISFNPKTRNLPIATIPSRKGVIVSEFVSILKLGIYRLQRSETTQDIDSSFSFQS